jgi:hypothetical protein
MGDINSKISQAEQLATNDQQKEVTIKEVKDFINDSKPLLALAFDTYHKTDFLPLKDYSVRKSEITEVYFYKSVVTMNNCVRINLKHNFPHTTCNASDYLTLRNFFLKNE